MNSCFSWRGSKARVSATQPNTMIETQRAVKHRMQRLCVRNRRSVGDRRKRKAGQRMDVHARVTSLHPAFKGSSRPNSLPAGAARQTANAASHHNDFH